MNERMLSSRWYKRSDRWHEWYARMDRCNDAASCRSSRGPPPSVINTDLWMLIVTLTPLPPDDGVYRRKVRSRPSSRPPGASRARGARSSNHTDHAQPKRRVARNSKLKSKRRIMRLSAFQKKTGSGPCPERMVGRARWWGGEAAARTTSTTQTHEHDKTPERERHGRRRVARFIHHKRTPAPQHTVSFCFLL